MFKKNMGRFDRTVRLIAGVALIPTGLVLLGGSQGHLTGILVTVFALLPIGTGVTGYCPGYIPFGISTLGSEQPSTKVS